MKHTFRRVVAETNIFDSAIGFAVAVGFVKLVNMFVTYVLTPPIGALIKGKQLSNFDFSLPFPGNGPILIRYGLFLDSLVEFILVILVVYWIARVVLRIKRAAAETIQKTKFCEACYMKIPAEAQICPYCRSETKS